MTDGLRWQEVFSGAEEQMIDKKNGKVTCLSFLPASARSCVLSELKEDQLVFSGFDPLQGRKGKLARVELGLNSGYYNTIFDTFWDLSPDGSRSAFGGCEPHGGHIHIWI